VRRGVQWLRAQFFESRRSMDLIDEQLEVLEPLIPDHFRRVDGRGRP